MRDWTLREVAALIGGRLEGKGDRVVEGVSINTRTLQRGDLYVALRGKRLDGHRFTAEAIRKGAVGALVEKPVRGVKGAQVTVADSALALGDLGRASRLQWNGPLVAVTGSAGKTTVKDLAGYLMNGDRPTLTTRGNLNNRFGLPLTLLGLAPWHRAAVVELGINHPGEMAELAGIARPDGVVVTMIGDAHGGNFKDRAQVASEKLKALDGIRKGGWAVINQDDPMLRTAARRADALTFGLKGGDVTADGLRLGSDRTFFNLKAGSKRYPTWVRLLGEHHVMNALAAVAAAMRLGLSPGKLAWRLKGFQALSPMRMQLVTRQGTLFVNDAYNASPDSMEAALTTFSRIEGPGRRAAVLGDMLELGALGPRAHRTALDRALELGLDRLVVVGPLMAAAARSVRADDRVTTVPTAVEAGRWLKAWSRRGDMVLLKGSRGMSLEKTLEAF